MPVTLELFRDDPDFRIVSAGATVFEAGDPGDAMYVVLEGELELYIGETKVDTLGPGDIFGEMALIDHAPRAASAVAKTLCKLVPVSEQRFLLLVQQTPRFSLQIMKVMAERLRKLDRLL
jgi:CRP/FNR family cyclic AMP-dependent transcriptional regulator